MSISVLQGGVPAYFFSFGLLPKKRCNFPQTFLIDSPGNQNYHELTLWNLAELTIEIFPTSKYLSSI